MTRLDKWPIRILLVKSLGFGTLGLAAVLNGAVALAGFWHLPSGRVLFEEPASAA